jgi:hypothetical protein
MFSTAWASVLEYDDHDDGSDGGNGYHLCCEHNAVDLEMSSNPPPQVSEYKMRIKEC